MKLIPSILFGIGAIGSLSLLRAHPNHFPSQFLLAANRDRPQAAPVLGNAQGDARLSVTIVDSKTGKPTAVRVRITDETGKPVGMFMPAERPLLDRSAVEGRLALPGSIAGLPREAVGVLYGMRDSADGYAFQPDGAFYVHGAFEMPMPAGKFRIALTKGYEFVRETEEIVLKPGENLSRHFALRRWIDMPERGWHSSDDHIHIRRSPRDNPQLIDWIAGEDIHVGVFLEVGDFWATYFTQYAWGEKALYGTDGYLLSSGQEEPRTDELGHTISIGARQFVRFQDDYFSYDRVFDRVHELGGVSGYAHQGMTFHGYRGMTLDVLAGKIDFLELMQFCAQQGPLAVDHYYLFLDLGYKLTALAGSDFPWCGRTTRFGAEVVGPQIGDARFYTHTGGPLTLDRWLTGIKAGNTFVTTGPVLDFRVNGQLPGSSLDVKPGTKLRISATARGHASQIPLQRLQIIGHGKALAEVRAGEKGQTSDQLAVDFELGVEHGVWLAARTDAGVTQAAHTTPVYVTVNGDGFQNRANLASQIALAKRYLPEIRDFINGAAGGKDRPAPRTAPGPAAYSGGRAKLERRVAEAEAKLEELRRRP